MNWIESVTRWRRLAPEEKLHRRWRAIPLDVAQSMAFEKEEVDLGLLERQLARIEPPGISKPPKVSSPTPS